MKFEEGLRRDTRVPMPAAGEPSTLPDDRHQLRKSTSRGMFGYIGKRLHFGPKSIRTTLE